MNANELKALINMIHIECQAARAELQMTLGELIDLIAKLEPSAEIEGITHPHSYRGYYCDLAFEACEKITASEALKVCKSAMGEIFVGYKGGEYQMGRNTPVWLANYGSCGSRIMGINPDGTMSLASDD